jgi:hypothetical protein
MQEVPSIGKHDELGCSRILQRKIESWRVKKKFRFWLIFLDMLPLSGGGKLSPAVDHRCFNEFWPWFSITKALIA